MPPRALARTLVAAALAAALIGCDQAVSPARVRTAPRETPLPEPSFADLPRDAIGGTIAFSSPTDAERGDIHTLDLGDPSARRVRLTTRPEDDFDPDLSPDGRRIVFRTNPGENDEADLWRIDADGDNLVNLTNDPTRNNWSPAWSPDGTRIAFASTRDGGTLRVWTMDPDGGDLQAVTATHGEYPDWSPDGTRIVYAAPLRGSSGRYDLWTIAADGSGVATRVTDAPTTEFAPAWSPDGEWIAYQSDGGNRWELWIVRSDGTEAHRVSPAEEDGVWPAWSPDGLLAWSGTRGLTFVDLDGGRSRSLRPAQPGTDFLSWGR